MSAIHEITDKWQREGLSPTWVKLQQAKAEYDALVAIVEQVQADRAELVKKLMHKADLLRGCYARINGLEKALRELHDATKLVSVGNYDQEGHDIAVSRALAALEKNHEGT